VGPAGANTDRGAAGDGGVDRPVRRQGQAPDVRRTMDCPSRRPAAQAGGELRIGPVKTNAGRRDLPLLPLAADMFAMRRDAQAADREELGGAWQDNGLIFTTRTGRPIEPRNLIRSFHRICSATPSAAATSWCTAFGSSGGAYRQLPETLTHVMSALRLAC
jgi:hypothetical protein